MYRFSIILTELCNAKCSHCYMADNRSKKTLTREKLKTIIEKMPDSTQSVVFTGGEIFLVEDLVMDGLILLKKKFGNIIIGLQSNGIVLYKNLEETKKKLKVLKQNGVSFIKFSDDPFHEVGGVNLESVRELKKLENEVGLEFKYLKQDKALAIGKAKHLEDKYKEKRNCMNNAYSITSPYLFIDVLGNVFICNWECVPPIGNMMNNSWEEITYKLNDKFNQLILSGKIEEAINLLEKSENTKNENIEYSKQYGQCMLCDKKFTKIRK